MKSDSEFKNYYDTVIIDQIASLEKERQKAAVVKNFSIGLLIAIISIIIFIIWYNPGFFAFGVMLILICLLGYAAITYPRLNDYKFDFHDIVIKGIITFLENNLEYDPDKSI